MLDQVTVAVVSPLGFSDAGFENPNLGSGNSAFQYDPAASTWSFSGTAGVAGNSSGFTAANPTAPQGSQVGFIQAIGTIGQVVNFAAAGSYLIGVTPPSGATTAPAPRRSRCWWTAR